MALKRLGKADKVVFLARRARHARHARWRSAVAGLDARIAELERMFGSRSRATAAFSLTARMRAALIASALIHLLIIFGIGFPMLKKPQPGLAENALEVVLVNAKTRAAPMTADALAQHNLDGGGNVDDKRRAQTPLPVLSARAQEGEVKLALRRVEQLEREARQVMTQAHSEVQADSAPAAKPNQVTEAEVKSEPSASEIMQRSVEIARLEAKISNNWNGYQERPRRRTIGSRTQESRFARYIDDWRQKIERVGDLNYPQAARDQRINGRLVVTVAIRADGSVEQVDINVPSGHKILDEAARRIVQLAAPFSAFPADIAKDVDILHITRTWTFTAADRFVSE